MNIQRLGVPEDSGGDDSRTDNLKVKRRAKGLPDERYSEIRDVERNQIRSDVSSDDVANANAEKQNGLKSTRTAIPTWLITPRKSEID